MTLSPDCHVMLLTIVLMPCVVFGTMTHSSGVAPMMSAVLARTSLRSGSQSRRMKRSGFPSILARSFCRASATGRGTEPYDPIPV